MHYLFLKQNIDYIILSIFNYMLPYAYNKYNITHERFLFNFQ